VDQTEIIAALATALVGTWAAFSRAFFRGDLIPGMVYQREVTRGDQATTQAERNRETLTEILRLVSGKPNAPAG
jgi:hypothetical protein